MKMFISAPSILMGIIKEHLRLRKIIRETRIDGILSDNRYGLWNKVIPCVFLTHQVYIKTSPSLKFLRPFINAINHFFIRKYKVCWIPDFPGEKNLSGSLSHSDSLPGHCRYIGPLSRFNELNPEEEAIGRPRYDIAFILSGPEPQRTILEQKVFKQLAKKNIRAVVVRGVLHNPENYCSDQNTEIYSYIDFVRLREVIRESAIVVCRPGYSSIMDLEAIGRKAVLVPTPGQTEQEYLAKHLVATRGFVACSQDELDIDFILRNAPDSVSEHTDMDTGMLKKEIIQTFGHLLKNNNPI